MNARLPNKQFISRVNSAGGVPKYTAELKAKVSGYLKTLGVAAPQAPALDSNPLLNCFTLEGYADELHALAAANKPAAAAGQFAKQVVALATHPAAAVREPMVAGIEKSLAARLGLEKPSCTRAEFDSLNDFQKTEFFQNGGRIAE